MNQKRLSVVGSTSSVNATRSSLQVNEISRTKYYIWRIMVVLCIIPAWIISLAPLGGPLYSEILPKPNISQNEILLEKLDLSNMTVLCPYPFIYSSDKQMCQLKCGTVYFYYTYIIKKIIYIILTLINTGITSFAIYRSIKIRKELRFQHHPIIVGIFFNLVLSFLMGIPDLIGSDIFYCENREIDYDTLHENPPIQLNVMGALVTIFGNSTRLWFLMALVLILLSVSFPMRDLFGSVRNRIVILTIEIIICIFVPCILTMARFTPFTGYKLSEDVLLPTSANPIVSIVCGVVFHLTISSVTFTVILLIIYKIHSQMQLGAGMSGKPQSVHPIEKRLIFFSVVFFLMTLVISVSLITNFVRDNQLQHQINDYFAKITLQSPFYIPKFGSSMLNQTLSLLMPEDQLLVQDSVKPFVFEIRGLTIRMMFIFVLSMLNFPCSKMNCKKRREGNVQIRHNKKVVVNV